MAFLVAGNYHVVRMDVQTDVVEMADGVAEIRHVMVMVARLLVVGQVIECGHSMLVCPWWEGVTVDESHYQPVHDLHRMKCPVIVKQVIVPWDFENLGGPETETV